MDPKEALIRVLTKKLPDLEAIYLFGSRAEGTEKIGSDWDFAFLSRKGLKPAELWDIKSQLEAQYNEDIDILDLYHVDTVTQIEVIKSGKVLWNANNFYPLDFESVVISMYQKLNEERGEILKQVSVQGNIHG
ncbi:MAG: nucleotidyltransferase domain-containing protein [Cyclobacteriaceae bacterium]